MKNKEQAQGMTLIVKTITRLTVGLVLLYGFYIVLHGDVSPGGGFSGGVIVALSFVNLMLAFGKEATLKRISLAKAMIIQSSGITLFLLIAILGFTGGHFFLNFFSDKGEPFRLFSGGIIPLCNIAICLNVAAGLYIIFVALVLFKSSNGKS